MKKILIALVIAAGCFALPSTADAGGLSSFLFGRSRVSSFDFCDNGFRSSGFRSGFRSRGSSDVRLLLELNRRNREIENFERAILLRNLRGRFSSRDFCF